MLRYVLTDVNGQATSFFKPVSMNIVTSLDAPADSFKASFYVSGEIPVINSAAVYNGEKLIFFGYADEQRETKTDKGCLLEIRARSLAALLLDNEAMPCTYCLMNMELLFERHFKPLGFKGYIGTSEALDKRLIIKKGMNEWDVLENFCRLKYKSRPFVTNDGYIDTGEAEDRDTVFLGGNKRISRIFRRSAVISDIYTRLEPGGDYIMHTQNTSALSKGIIRKRCFNAADKNRKSNMLPEEMINESNRKAEVYIIETDNIAECSRGDRLIIPEITKNLVASEIHFILGSKGEKTIICAEGEK